MLRKGRTRPTEVKGETQRKHGKECRASRVRDSSLADGWQGNWDFISPAARK